MTSEDIFGDHAPGRINEIGDFATCGCGLPIQYNGDGWEHLNGKGYPHLPRPEKPLTDADRIAAAVAVLNNCLLTIDKAAAFPSKDYFLNQQITKALAILEGRDQG